MDKIKSRPVYLNLLKIRMPVAAVVSILQRVSGVVLALSIPIILYVFDYSLRGPVHFKDIIHFLNLPLIQIILLIALYLLVHHFFAGLRFLLIDMDVGVSKKASITSAWLVHVLAISSTAVFAGVLL